MAVEYIRTREAGERLGFASTYGPRIIPKLLPTVQPSGKPNGPRMVRLADLERYISELDEQPGATTPDLQEATS